MMDFALKGSDVAIEGGDFVLCSTDKGAVAQAIVVRLKTMSGEWFLDTTQGIPYLTEVFGLKRSEHFIRQLVATAIETVPGIIRLDEFKAQISTARTMIVSFTVLLSDHTSLHINESIGL